MGKDVEHKVHQDFVAIRKHYEHAEQVPLTEMYLGLAARRDGDTVQIGYCTHDGTYSVDFANHSITTNDNIAGDLADHILNSIRQYRKDHLCKFLGGGVNKELVDISPDLVSRSWMELDIIMLRFDRAFESSHEADHKIGTDEAADAMVRKAILFFGPSKQPRITIGFRNEVRVDAGYRAHLTTLEQYKNSVGEKTWQAAMHYAERLKERKTRIAFFNSTPQGGGVALMRHTLIRFLKLHVVSRLHGKQTYPLPGITIVDNTFRHVPQPKPEVFRITKMKHNILQGVARDDERLTDDQAEVIRRWATQNAEREWLSGEGDQAGPLVASKNGGADFIVVDDPQMPHIVKLAKEADPHRPVVFRSHIQIRADLVDDKPDSNTAHVFKWLYDLVKEADLFIAHPSKEFVPKVVKPETVAYLPATTDWLDGLNKNMEQEDRAYYQRNYDTQCHAKKQAELAYPKRPYIIQVARFDPFKGIDTVVKAYGELRRNYLQEAPEERIPQLVIAGHSAIDDPDATQIYDKISELIKKEYSDIADDISMMRLGPVDQELNMLMSNAKVALQLSTREGFEVKVSEALHKGKPVVATTAGGIPLQVADGKSGFLGEPNDFHAVAEHLNKLFTDDELYEAMSKYAKEHVSDEVSTVGNALSWLYLADAMTNKGEVLKPNGEWVNDMAREAAGFPYEDGENRLPRHLKT